LSRPDLATGPPFCRLHAKQEPPVGGLSQPRRDTVDPKGIDELLFFYELAITFFAIVNIK